MQQLHHAGIGATTIGRNGTSVTAQCHELTERSATPAAATSGDLDRARQTLSAAARPGLSIDDRHVQSLTADGRGCPRRVAPRPRTVRHWHTRPLLLRDSLRQGGALRLDPRPFSRPCRSTTIFGVCEESGGVSHMRCRIPDGPTDDEQRQHPHPGGNQRGSRGTAPFKRVGRAQRHRAETASRTLRRRRHDLMATYSANDTSANPSPTVPEPANAGSRESICAAKR
jgi:hypothetical protein